MKLNPKKKIQMETPAGSGFDNDWKNRPLWQMVEVTYSIPKGAKLLRRLVNIAVKHEMENRYRELKMLKEAIESKKPKSLIKSIFNRKDHSMSPEEKAEMSWIYSTLLEMNKYANKIQAARDIAKKYPLRTNLQTGSYYRKATR